MGSVECHFLLSVQARLQLPSTAVPPSNYLTSLQSQLQECEVFPLNSASLFIHSNFGFAVRKQNPTCVYIPFYALLEKNITLIRWFVPGENCHG